VSAEPEFLRALRSFEGLPREAADALYEAGYTTPMAIASASPGDMARIRGMPGDLVQRLMSAFSAPPQEKPGAAPAPPPQPAPPQAAGQIHELERSFSYLVEEDRPETSYHLFVNALRKGMKGYCVTRNYPAKIRTKFELKDTPIIWLSNVGRDNAIRPKDLEKLSLSLEQFLSQSGGGIVLLDGLEYLITNNNFITVLRLIQSLRDQVAINQSILLMAVNRSTLESHQLNLLEREVDYTIQG